MTKNFSVYILALTLFFSISASANAPIFVSPEWTFKNKDNITLIDLSGESSYQRFHLPNAIRVDYGWLLQPQRGLNLSGGIGYMTQLLSHFGIQPDDHIVIYDNLGGLNAGRLYWELIKLNHNKVSILNGGINAWVLNGFPVTQSSPKTVPSNYPAPKIDLTDTFNATKVEVLTAIDLYL